MMLSRAIPYFWAAQTKYRIHSPFVGQWIEEVLEDRRWYYAFDTLRTQWTQLRADRRIIEVTDLGAGSRTGQSAQRTIGQIARSAVCTPYKGRFLFRQALFSRPHSILELGTSLGFSAQYFLAAAPQARMATIEGCPNIAAVARERFRTMEGRAPELYVGDFDQVLPDVLPNWGPIDLLYLDGNHQEAPTLRYFEQCLPYMADHSVVLLDDIYWSPEMLRAWETLVAHPKVALSLDVFHTGLLFLKKDEKLKKHFTLTPWHWKPWQSGFLFASTGKKEFPAARPRM
jgi:predicted O-methyltransferase YrrM